MPSLFSYSILAVGLLSTSNALIADPRVVQARQASGVKVLMANDDGWAETNFRTFYSTLKQAGYDVLASAPATQKSGTGSTEADPVPLDANGGQYGTIPAGAPAIGHEANDDRMNYVNSYPATSIHVGINQIAPKFWGSTKPDLVVTGPNAGSNLGPITLFSGTVGAACKGVSDGVPSIAFSADNDASFYQAPGNETLSKLFASISTKIVGNIVASGKPYLPANTFLNVNLPKPTSKCPTVDGWKFVLTDIYWNPTSKDASTGCNDISGELPWEVTAIKKECVVTISVADSRDKTDNVGDAQAVVYQKLKSILSCP